MFVWTGFDYLENPRRTGGRHGFVFGIDLAGFPKDYYMYQSEWTDRPVLHVFPHWNWQEGEPVDVKVLQRADSVALFLNGKSLGWAKRRNDLMLPGEYRLNPEPLQRCRTAKERNCSAAAFPQPANRQNSALQPTDRY